MKPRARSVYFSIFMVHSLGLPLRPAGTDTASSLGFRKATLTSLNQPAVSSPPFSPASGRCGKLVPVAEEAVSQIRARWRPPPESPKKPDARHPARANRQPLSLSRQRPVAGATAFGRAKRRPDASGRPSLCDRERPQRLRSDGAGVDAKILFP